MKEITNIWHYRQNGSIQNTASNNNKIHILLKHTQNILQARSFAGPQSKLNKLNTDNIPCIFSHHNDIKLEINNKRKFLKFNNMWKLNNTQQIYRRKRKTKYKNTYQDDLKRYHS